MEAGVAPAPASPPLPSHRTFLRPGLLAVLAVMAGQCVAANLPAHAAPFALALAVAAAAACCLLPARRFGFVVAFCAAFLGVGAWQQCRLNGEDAAARGTLEALYGSAAPLAVATGALADLPNRTSAGWTLFLERGARLEALGRVADFPGRVIVRLPATEATDALLREAVAGDGLQVAGALRELPHERWSGEADDWVVPSGALAFLQGRWARATTGEAERSPLASLTAAAQRLSRNLEARTLRALPEREAAVLLAMGLGRTHLLTAEQKEIYRRTGLLHLFSVSGLHTMLVGGMLLLALRQVGGPVALRLALLALLMGGFCLLVGPRNAVLRAALLLVLVESRDLLRRPIDGLGALGSVALVLLLWSPRALWQVDFQLSYLCMVALVLLTPWQVALERHLGARLGWRPGSSLVIGAAKIFTASVAIQLLLTPVFAARFGEVSIIAPLANVLLLKPAEWALQGAFLAYLLAQGIPWLGDGILAVLTPLLRVVELCAGFLASLPGATASTPAWPVWATLLYFLLLLGTRWNLLPRPQAPRPTPAKALPFALALVVFLAIVPWAARPPGGGLEVWFLDVGQGDAILIREPGGATLLVDAGPPAAGRALPGMLRERGVRALDLALATHADADHIGGFPELLEHVPVAQFLVGGSLASTELFADLAEAIREHQLPVATVQRGAVLQLGPDVFLQVLHPTPDFVEAGDDRNDGSVVLRLEYAGRGVLLTGDAEHAAEQALLASGALLRADVLKAGHHGSAGSTSAGFLQAVAPAVAVMSCGRSNRYGHPSPAVLRRVAEAGAAVRRTDEEGTLHLRITPDGTMLWRTTR